MTARLLQVYQDRHRLNTLRGIINRWAPASDNGGQAVVDGMIVRAAQMTGFGADQPLNLHDSETLARVTEAMIRNETGAKGPSNSLIRGVIGGLRNKANGSSSSDSGTQHHVTVSFNNLPAGARTNVTGSGNASLALNTRYALSYPLA
jgi:hypothetical protein